jgi:hypothetical protein
MNTPKKPGETPPKPGHYTEIGPDRQPVTPPHEVDMPRGHKPLPPTQKPHHEWMPQKKK